MPRRGAPSRQAGSSRRTARLLLWCAATDSTYERGELGGREVLTGTCIHCGARHSVSLTGVALTQATLEHIVPRTHGGTDAIENLAIACARCNIGKGQRLDLRPWSDPTLQRVIATLQERKLARARTPPGWIDLPPLPAARERAGEDDDAS